jgi:hypothetical protein
MWMWFEFMWGREQRPSKSRSAWALKPSCKSKSDVCYMALTQGWSNLEALEWGRWAKDTFSVEAYVDLPCAHCSESCTCECSETCIMAIHVVSQDDLISIAQFDLDQHQNISSPQTECNSLLSLCPYIKHSSKGHAFKRTLQDRDSSSRHGIKASHSYQGQCGWYEVPCVQEDAGVAVDNSGMLGQARVNFFSASYEMVSHACEHAPHCILQSFT